MSEISATSAQVPRIWINFVLAAVALSGVAGVAGFRWLLLHHPDVYYLTPEHGAEWIRIPAQTNAVAYTPGRFLAWFRCDFEITSPPTSAVLTVRAHRTARVTLDGRELSPKRADLDAWKAPVRVDLTGVLPPGNHILLVEVENRDAWPALLAYCPDINLFSGKDWTYTEDGKSWRPVQTLTAQPAPTPAARSTGTVAAGWIRTLPISATAFLAVFLLSCWRRTDAGLLRTRALVPAPARFRFALIIAWFALGLNNILRQDGIQGFDRQLHLDYIEFILSNHRIPLATDGLQMFQSPLHYLIAALVFAVLDPLLPHTAVIRAVRFLPFCYGAVQIEASYRILRLAFPGNDAIQRAGLIVAGFIPVTLYMAHDLGNEPLAAMFTALTLLALFRILRYPETAAGWRAPAVTGLWLGLAMLSKVTPVLLIPVVCFVLAHAWISLPQTRTKRVVGGIRSAAVTLTIAFAVAGWYYVRNWILLGAPFVGGWSKQRGLGWWQDPGYRNPVQLFSFGESLVHPVHSGMRSIADGLYSTLWLDGLISGRVSGMKYWNEPAVLAVSWWSLPLTILLFIGLVIAVREFRAKSDALPLSALAALAVYFAAIFYYALMLPTYSAIKASYALGLTPCIAILILLGARPIADRFPANAALWGIFGAWFACVYTAFFIV